MLFTTAAVAVGRKISHERGRKKDAKQDVLRVEDMDVAKSAFAHQLPPTAKAVENARIRTHIKFESADLDAATSSPTESSPGLTSPQAERGCVKKASPPWSVAGLSHVKSERGTLLVSSPSTEQGKGSRSRAQSMRSSWPPSYSPGDGISPVKSQTSTNSSHTSDTNIFATTTLSRSSRNPNAVRVKTNRAELRSGFPYHPALFDLQVHPERWEAFTHQIVETTKLSNTDTAQMWAAATATAMTGALIPSVWVGRTMRRTLQEKKVRQSLAKVDDGGLGDVLSQWNEEYFRKQGLFVHLELSESALKSSEGKSKAFRKPVGLYVSREERDRKRDERKFVIVVSKLEDNGSPTEETIHEMAAEGSAAMHELPMAEDVRYDVVEAPGDEAVAPVELPAMAEFLGVSLGFGNEEFAPRMEYAELESDIVGLLGKMEVINGQPIQELEDDRQARDDVLKVDTGDPAGQRFETDIAKSPSVVVVEE